MKYTIIHGNIACIIDIRDSDGNDSRMIYMNKGKIEASDHSHMKFNQLPLSVAVVVVNQFKEVFDLPITQRAAWIEKQLPIEVTV